MGLDIINLLLIMLWSTRSFRDKVELQLTLLSMAAQSLLELRQGDNLE